MNIKIKYKNKAIDQGYNPGYILEMYSVTYKNGEKTQTQNVLKMKDIVVPVMIKKGEDGKKYFAMEYVYVPAKNQIFLEVPSIRINATKKSKYSDTEIEISIEELVKRLGLKTFSYEDKNKIRILKQDLSSVNVPVSQSITDQTAKFVCLEVKESKRMDKRLNWFSINCIDNILLKANMSVQTYYALFQLKKKYKSEISKTAEVAELKNELFEIRPNIEEEIIWPNKCRFGLSKVKKIPDKIKELYKSCEIEIAKDCKSFNEGSDSVVVGKSDDSVQIVIIKEENGKEFVGLIKQQRSPFICRKGISEFLIETPAGMIDEGEKPLDAAVREAKEETGIEVLKKYVKLISDKLLSSIGTEEMSYFYMAKLPKNYKQGKQKLDEQENISEIKWYEVESLNIDEIHAPLSTKIALEMAINRLKK